MKRLTPGKLIFGTAALLILSCIIFAVTIVSRFLSPYIGGDSLETQLSKLKASGEPTTMAELVGPAIPDSQNAALIYQKAFKQMGFPKNKQLFSARAESLLDDWKIGKADVYPKMEEFVSQYEAVMPLVEKAAVCPKCHFSVNWEDGLDAKLDHLDYLRCLSKLLACTAIVEARKGRMESAVHSIELGLILADALQGEPSIISFLTRIERIKLACFSIQSLFESGQMTEPQARRLYDALSAIELNTHYKLALRGERIQGIILYKQLAKSPKDSAKTSDSELNLGPMKPLLQPDQTYFFKMMKSRIDNADVPQRLLTARKTNEALERGTPRLALVSTIFAIGTNASRDTALAVIDASKTALTLQVYHNAAGVYPKSLSQLTTEPGWKLNLQDPFSGKDFVYKRKGNGYLLYSIGKNLKDEGGLDDYSPAQRALHPKPDKPDDIVWKIDR